MGVDPLAAEPTGIPGLDLVLGGGLPQRGIVFVAGGPGTGKTVLVQQLVFAAARRGRPSLYFSGFSEPHERLIEHLRPFSFFDESLLAGGVQLLSLTSAVEQGADAAVDMVVQTTRRTRAGLVVVDGFVGLRRLLDSNREAVRFLYHLGAQVGLVGALLVVVVEGSPRDPELTPELAAGDLLLGLFFERMPVGHRRQLEVLKRRGAAALHGMHALTIGSAGVTCYPQLEMVVSQGDAPFDVSARAPFDLPELDAMLGGGLTQGTVTILAGNSSTGKTLLGLKFLAAGAARQEPGLLLGFHESREQLLAKAAAHGIDLAGALERGMIRLLVQPPIALDPDIVAHHLQAAIAEGGTRRLVIDSVVELERAVERERVDDYLAALVTLLRGRGITAVLTRETPRLFSAEVDFTGVPISVLAENLLLLRHVPFRGELHRVIAVIKVRFSDHDRTIREFTIDERGLTVLRRWDSGEGVLEGLAADPSEQSTRAPRPPTD